MELLTEFIRSTRRLYTHGTPDGVPRGASPQMSSLQLILLVWCINGIHFLGGSSLSDFLFSGELAITDF